MLASEINVLISYDYSLRSSWYCDALWRPSPPNHPPPGPSLKPCSQASSVQQYLTGMKVVSMGSCIGMQVHSQARPHQSSSGP